MRSLFVLSFGLLLVSCRRSAPPAPQAEAPEIAQTTTSDADAAASAAPDTPAPWVEAHYPGWAMATRPPATIDWSSVTDLVLFGLVPYRTRADAMSTGLTPERIAAATSAARAGGANVLVCVGGERTGGRFRDAIAGDGGSALASSVGAFVVDRGLDGVVLDIEPLADVPERDLVSFVKTLRERLRTNERRLRVEAVVAPDAREIARLVPIASELDRVAIMSYLGAPSDAEERELVDAVARAGVARSNIGVGIDARTPGERSAERADLVRSGRAGGMILWHAATLCALADGGAKCDLGPRGLRR